MMLSAMEGAQEPEQEQAHEKGREFHPTFRIVSTLMPVHPWSKPETISVDNLVMITGNCKR